MNDIVKACGAPEMTYLYDEEGVEGWKWTHPDGREWSEIGAHDEPPPPHPALGTNHLDNPTQ